MENVLKMFVVILKIVTMFFVDRMDVEEHVGVKQEQHALHKEYVLMRENPVVIISSHQQEWNEPMLQVLWTVLDGLQKMCNSIYQLFPVEATKTALMVITCIKDVKREKIAFALRTLQDKATVIVTMCTSGGIMIPTILPAIIAQRFDRVLTYVASIPLERLALISSAMMGQPLLDLAELTV